MSSPVADEPAVAERDVVRESRVGVSDGAALREGGRKTPSRRKARTSKIWRREKQTYCWAGHGYPWSEAATKA